MNKRPLLFSFLLVKWAGGDLNPSLDLTPQQSAGSCSIQAELPARCLMPFPSLFRPEVRKLYKHSPELPLMPKTSHQEMVPLAEERESSCSSCRRSLTNSVGSVKFPCPACGETTIVRCFSCRQISVRYECPACGFSGPN